jgi:hypothetical protein
LFKLFKRIRSLFGWQEGFVGKRFLDIDDVSDTVGVAAVTEELVPGPVDLLRLNTHAIWVDVVSMAEINAILALFNSTNEGSSNTPSVEHEWEIHDLVWLSNTSKLD